MPRCRAPECWTRRAHPCKRPASVHLCKFKLELWLREFLLPLHHKISLYVCCMTYYPTWWHMEAKQLMYLVTIVNHLCTLSTRTKTQFLSFICLIYMLLIQVVCWKDKNESGVSQSQSGKSSLIKEKWQGPWSCSCDTGKHALQRKQGTCEIVWVSCGDERRGRKVSTRDFVVDCLLSTTLIL